MRDEAERRIALEAEASITRDPSALLGLWHRIGEVYERRIHDHAAAQAWYRKAAEQGHAPAQFNLALRHEKGDGVTQDSAAAESRPVPQEGYTAEEIVNVAGNFFGGTTEGLAKVIERVFAEQGKPEDAAFYRGIGRKLAEAHGRSRRPAD